MEGDAFGRYGSGLEGDHFFRHLNVQTAVIEDAHFQAHVFHRVAAEIEVVFAGGHLHTPEAVTVGHGVVGGFLVIDGDAHNGFRGGLVAHIAVDDGLAALPHTLLVSNLVDFVQIGSCHVLLLQHFLLLRPAQFEPVGAQVGAERMAVDDIQAALPLRGRITGRKEFFQGLVQELGTGSRHAVGGRVIPGTGNEEAASRHPAHHLHQGIGRHHTDAYRIVLGVGGQRQQQDRQKDTNASHGH